MSPRRARAVRDRAGDPATALREHLLETTERLLAEHPPAALTTRRIARAARVSDGVLYNHFADKDDLVLAATVRRFARLLDGYRAAVPAAGSDTVERNLKRAAKAALQLHRELLPILAGFLSDPELLARFMKEIHREHVGAVEIVGAIERYLATERAAGRIEAVDTRGAADLVVGAVAVGAMTGLLGVPASDVQEGVLAAVEALVAGLEPRT